MPKTTPKRNPTLHLKAEIWKVMMPKYCKGKCGRKSFYQNKTGHYKEYFCRFILSPKRADASRRDKKTHHNCKLSLNGFAEGVLIS